MSQVLGTWAPWTFKPAFFRNNDGYLMGVCIYIYIYMMETYGHISGIVEGLS